MRAREIPPPLTFSHLLSTSPTFAHLRPPSLIYGSEDPDVLIDAFEAGSKPANKGKKPRRAAQKASKVEEAKQAVAKIQEKLARGTKPDLLDDAAALLKEDLDEYFPSFKKSKCVTDAHVATRHSPPPPFAAALTYTLHRPSPLPSQSLHGLTAAARTRYFDLYARSRSMEAETCHEDDFHMFRVLGVGGFGAVHAAVKKDTGARLVPSCSGRASSSSLTVSPPRSDRASSSLTVPPPPL